MYWGSNPGISRANLDGSVLESPFIRPAVYSLCGLAVDSTHIYWADSHGDKIGRAKLDGTAVESDLISSAGNLPCDIAVDSSHIYWTERGSKTINRAKLDGSSVERGLISTESAPCGLAVGPNAIYWAAESESKIWTTDIAGLNPPKVVVDDTSYPCDLALTSTHLYWAARYWATREYGVVSRANFDGSAASKLFSVPGDVSDIAIGENYLYWVNSHWEFESIGRASLDGTQVDPAFLTGQKWPYALAADSLQVVPPVVTPLEQSQIRVGKLRRNKRNGSVTFPMDIYEDGWLRVASSGVRVTVLPEGIEGNTPLRAGRKLIRISPTTVKGGGSRCVLKAFRNGGKVKLTLLLGFQHPGKTPVEETRDFVLFNPRIHDSLAQNKRKRSPVTCAAPPKS